VSAAADEIIKGTVMAGRTPLPGVAVTATDTSTGKGYVTATDVDGAFQMSVPSGGRYVVKTELAGFASTTQEVDVNAAGANGVVVAQTAAFTMDLASRVAPVVATTGPAKSGSTPSGSATTATATATPGRTGNGTTRNGGAAAGAARGSVARVGRGTQSLAMQNNSDSNLLDATANQGNTGAQLPSLAGGDDTSATSDSIAVSGQQGHSQRRDAVG